MAKRLIGTDEQGEKVVIDSKSVVKSILKTQELARLETEIKGRREKMEEVQSTYRVRDFIRELANDDDYSEVLAVKSKERPFIRSLYEKTDFNKVEIMYLFAIPSNVFNAWVNEEKWRKLTIKKTLSKESLIALLFSGEYNLIHVKKENAQNLKNKYNGMYYKIAEMSTKLLDDAIPDNNLLNALTKVVSILNNCYEKQLDVRNISGNAKDRKSIEFKEKELVLEERKVVALENANNIRIVTEPEMDKNKYTPIEMVRIMERFLSDKIPDEELKENLLKDMSLEFNVAELMSLEKDDESLEVEYEE